MTTSDFIKKLAHEEKIIQYLYLLCNCSDSMRGDKIECLNRAIRASIPVWKAKADDYPHLMIKIRVLEISTKVEWLKDYEPLNNLTWVDLISNGHGLVLGEAFRKLGQEMDKIPLSEEAFHPPIVILCTEGVPTDDWEDGLHKFISTAWGIRTKRLAIAIGGEYNLNPLNAFIRGDPYNIFSEVIEPWMVAEYATNVGQLYQFLCRALRYIEIESTQINRTSSFSFLSKVSDADNTLPGQMARRPLEFFFLCDCSGSMYGDKIESLNQAIKLAIPAFQTEAAANPYAQVYMRAIKYSNGAKWHLGAHTKVENFSWVDLNAGGSRDLGAALTLLSKELKIPPMDSRGLPPLIVLVADGEPTDDWETGLNTLMAEPWAKKSIRIAIAIGEFEQHALKSFTTGDPALAESQEIPPHMIPIAAKNADQFAKYIKWVSTRINSNDTNSINTDDVW